MLNVYPEQNCVVNAGFSVPSSAVMGVMLSQGVTIPIFGFGKLKHLNNWELYVALSLFFFPGIFFSAKLLLTFAANLISDYILVPTYGVKFN